MYCVFTATLLSTRVNKMIYLHTRTSYCYETSRTDSAQKHRFRWKLQNKSLILRHFPMELSKSIFITAEFHVFSHIKKEGIFLNSFEVSKIPIKLSISKNRCLRFWKIFLLTTFLPTYYLNGFLHLNSSISDMTHMGKHHIHCSKWRNTKPSLCVSEISLRYFFCSS